MRTRRNLMLGVAATLAVTACVIASGGSGGTHAARPAPVPAAVSARHVLAVAAISDQEWLARLKRHAAGPAGDAGRRG